MEIEKREKKSLEKKSEKKRKEPKTRLLDVLEVLIPNG